jgi:hypothetical protein
MTANTFPALCITCRCAVATGQGRLVVRMGRYRTVICQACDSPAAQPAPNRHADD